MCTVTTVEMNLHSNEHIKFIMKKKTSDFFNLLMLKEYYDIIK